MKNKELLIKALNTLLYSWGGDTPPEAIWAANELLKWLEVEYNVKFRFEFSEDPMDGEHNNLVLEQINAL